MTEIAYAIQSHEGGGLITCDADGYNSAPFLCDAFLFHSKNTASSFLCDIGSELDGCTPTPILLHDTREPLVTRDDLLAACESLGEDYTVSRKRELLRALNAAIIKRVEGV